MPISPYQVLIDDNFHFMDEDERYQLGVFDTPEKAIRACKRIVDEDLRSFHKPGMGSPELCKTFTLFGRDPFVIAPDPQTDKISFSAREYAKRKLGLLR